LETIKVTRKGQVTIPAPLRKKYNIREGMRIGVADTPSVLVLKPIPDMNDWAGADAGKYTYEEMTRKLDRLRDRWR
jgi:AbrB family looped-hinge helix DNA binding protein